ncbi:unnamed protein product [Linum tenue]|uniref:F-box domain-containing protein n=1 Tax=Linum tenue TaxID=586396 RepID=A0AAV0GQ82_9ROSI|nr:unnamed protein product [Linum tenue]
MATKRSRVHCEEERKGTTSGRRFTDLPDEVLHHILSFLDDTKGTVQTCILSKKWRHLWTEVRALHIRKDSSNESFGTPSFLQ